MLLYFCRPSFEDRKRLGHAHKKGGRFKSKAKYVIYHYNNEKFIIYQTIGYVKQLFKKSLFIKSKMSSFVFQVNLVLYFLSGSGGSEGSDTVENWLLSGPV